MMTHPILINRPLVVSPLGVKLCRPSEAVLDILPDLSAAALPRRTARSSSMPPGTARPDARYPAWAFHNPKLGSAAPPRTRTSADRINQCSLSLIFLATLVLVIWQPRGLGIGWSAMGGAVLALLTGVIGWADVPLSGTSCGTPRSRSWPDRHLSAAGRSRILPWAALHVARWGAATDGGCCRSSWCSAPSSPRSSPMTARRCC